MVLFDYCASPGSNELTLHEGDQVTNIVEVEPGWLRGSIGHRNGIIPASFVELDSQPSKKKKKSGGSRKGFYAVAIFDSVAEGVGEIGFASGDVIEVLDTEHAKGWWYGKCNGKEGIFPASYVREVDNDENDTNASLSGNVHF